MFLNLVILSNVPWDPGSQILVCVVQSGYNYCMISFNYDEHYFRDKFSELFICYILVHPNALLCYG